jgi:SNF2 family DNA or RNA helicase
MLKLEELRKDAIVKGIIPNHGLIVVSVDPVGKDAVTLYYRDATGGLAERMLFRADELNLEIVEEGRPWSFDGNGEDFKLAAEAYRIHLAHLFDPLMAVHSSTVEPLPHQIVAVYESMLPHQPLRFVLADDPGAGKTIMAGLFIRELMVRGDLKRCLIITPGGLVEQWQDELDQKFGLSFDIFSREMVEFTRSGNPFEEPIHLLVLLDQLEFSFGLLPKVPDIFPYFCLPFKNR